MSSFGLNQLREMFLSYFESKGHLRLPSFSLIPQNDASLLLINSGMAPMKPFFTGEVEPPRKRVCTCQKCIRTGDIENIGKTARHGTYFEMLGNFSFGDYFKKEAISLSWEFLTDVVGLDPNRLYPSIYIDDEEAFEIWNKHIGIPAKNIFRFGKKDNFWEHGSGPCGPCSEIYYDRGEKYGCGVAECTVGCDCDRYIEIWNNVFTQFYSDGQGNYTELEQKNIDTGMGLERLAVVCQDVYSLFDVDTVMNITNKVSELTNAHYGQSHKTDVSLRVITDHIRSATMMICDGVLPSNEGRGYVLRRLLRRAARHGKTLGTSEPFLFEVCDIVIRESESAYPDLRDKQSYITRVIKVEEENFAKTIDAGIKIYSDMLDCHKVNNEKIFSGADAFKLYDTYGFPIDLTIEMVEEEGMTLDKTAFDVLMQEQKVRARKAREALGDLGWAGIEFGKDMPSTTFVGYNSDCAEGSVLAIVADDELRDSIASGVEAIIVLDKTPMYAEMGGQVADHGVISGKNGKFIVSNVQKNKGGKYMHYGIVEKGEFSVGDVVEANNDTVRRRAIMRAHSATHLLHAALRSVLGDHVQQAGSLVEPDRLRFDFTHFSALTALEISKINKLVSEMILNGDIINTREMPIVEAKAIGATALFGEKYGDVVRVVNMADKSVELCGGTHLDNTAKIGSFRITSEFSVASGVRRIEAITGMVLNSHVDELTKVIAMAAETLKTNPGDMINKLNAYVGEVKEIHREMDTIKDKLLSGEAEKLLLCAKPIGDLRIFTSKIDGIQAADLRKMGDFIRDRDLNIIAVLASVNEGKISMMAVCGKNAIAKGVKAGDIIKTIIPICGGKGGGKPDSAMGGGTEVLKLNNALAAVDGFVAEKLGL